MGFDFTGYVIRPPRSASANAATTGEALSGVDRDHKPVPPAYVLPPTTGGDPEPFADDYRAAVLLRPTEGTDEYLVWAANTGSLTVLEDPAFAQDGDPTTDISSQPGSLSVTGGYTDGTATFLVKPANGRSFSILTEIKIKVGGQPFASPIVITSFASVDSTTGVMVLDAPTLVLLGGGFSLDRGDRVVGIRYVLARARFWWTKNDALQTRFGWSFGSQRWEPYKGSPVQNLGVLTASSAFRLTPFNARFDLGDFLPGNPLDADEYALVRLGSAPDATSSVPTIEVVADDVAATPGYAFAGQDAIVGIGSGVIQWNPAYIATNTGQAVWYSPEAYLTNSSGALGSLIDANQSPLFLSPLPEATDRPLVRLGYRTYLAPVPYDNDAALPLPNAVSPNTFAWSRTTGKMVFSDVDVAKATPGDPLYELPYLGTTVFFDGVSLTTTPLTTKDPVQLTDASGTPTPIALGLDMFIPLSEPLPFPGVSGIRYVPDGTGSTPDLGAGDPTTRVNGNDTGLVREVVGIGDTIFFLNDTKTPTFTDVDVVEYDADLPQFDFGVAKKRIFVSRQADPSTLGSVLSRVVFKRAGRVGNTLYFLQADVTPAVYADEPRIYSRLQEPFTFLGGESLRFALDGTPVTFTASAGTYTASAVAALLQAAITGASAPGTATALRGRVVLAANTSTVEIGWNADETDLSGNAVLGFLPGWRVDTSGQAYRWLPDNGSSLGVFRSPLNLDGAQPYPDFYDTNRIEATLVDSVFGSPTVTVNLPPLVDIPGFAPDVQFRLVRDLSFQNLYNWEDVLYEFDRQRFVWLDEGTQPATSIFLPTSPLALGFTGVVPETLNPDAMLDNSFGLYMRLPGASAFSLQTNTYFADGGQSGFVYLGDDVGLEVLQGTAGQFIEGTVAFTDLNVPDWNTVLPTPSGYRLAIRSGDAIGSYIINDIDPLNPNVLRVKSDVPFTASSAPFASWEIYEGVPDTVFDPAIVADRSFLDFSYLSSEPFVVRLLSDIGTVSPSTASYPSFLGPALASGRTLAARFGYGHTDPEVPITVLRTGLPIGIVAQTGLSVPDVADPFFASGNFQLRVNGVAFTVSGGDLIGAATLPPVSPVSTAIYFGNAGADLGKLYLGNDVVANFAGGTVVYDQVAPAPASIPSGFAFANPNTGDVAISLTDATTYAGQTLYLVEQLVINIDVSINPITGGVYVTLPLRTGQIVEAQYFKANTDGSLATDPVTSQPIEIVEYLSNVVRLETASRIDDYTYSFNPAGRTVDPDYPVTVWVGARQLNFAGRIEVLVDGNLLRFVDPVAASANVRLNYAALQALGGEQSYSISVIPAYRPPFFLTANQTTFTVEGDRTGSLEAGTLMLVGTSPFYVRSATYTPSGDTTTVEVWPSYPNEVGSRSPTNDLTTVVSSTPIALTIDPANPTPGLGSTGFLIAQPGLVYLPINRGDTSARFIGNQTTLIQPNRLLEIGGYPFFVTASELSDDGRFTTVTFSAPSLTGLSLLAGDAVFLTARAIYAPLSAAFVGISPYLNFRPIELVRFGLISEDGTPLPGKSLVLGVDFTADPTTGAITTTTPLLRGQSLLFRYTAEEILVGALEDGAELTASYKATYRYRTLPSTQNGLIGTSVVASYTYRNPDSFYYAVQTLRSYSAEVTKTVVGRSRLATSGPSIITSPTADNGAQGVLGFRGQIQDLYAQDRAARVLLLFYNEIVFTFEQTLEAMNGQLIGDRDGKFKFFVGRGLTYPPPGYEDPFSGRLNIRLLWAEVFASLNPQALIPAATDPLADPTEPITVDPNRPGRVDGNTPNPNMLDYLIEQQLPLVANDMDDRLLLGFRNPVVGAITAALLPKVDIFGLFKQAWQNSGYSRIYPEETLSFTQTIPGIDADLATGNKGFYTFARFGTMPSTGIGLPKIQVVRTNRKPIATFTNPVYGDIPNIQDATVRPRLARARIWAYSPTGFSGASGLAATQPCLIATPLDLSVFPIDPNTGLPDTTQLYGNGGNIYSLETGDPDLSTPPFQIGDLLAYGQPDGSAYTLGDQATPLPPYGGTPSGTNYVGIYVREVIDGCYLVLGTKDALGVVIAVSPGNIIIVETGDQFTALQGDTIFVGPDVQNRKVPASDPPTIEDSQALAAAIPNYRRDLDLYINKRASEIRDATFPSKEDPFIPIKEWLGQRPPGPLDTIEADVNFANTDKQPTRIPALLGQPLNDSGDVSIPYLSAYYNEINLLGQAAAKIRAFFGSDSAFATPYPLGVAANEQQTWDAIFPDEVVASDGEILAAAGLGVPNEAPSVLYTAQNLTPVSGPYVANSAIGNARPFDLLLMETNQPSMVGFAGATGILSIGDTTSASGGVPNGVEVPRFVTPTPYTAIPAFPPLRPHRYTVENAFGFTVPANPVTGVILTQVIGISTVTTFDFTSVGGLILDDGSGVYPPLGGLNWFFQPLTTNAVVLRIYSKITGVLVETFTFTSVNSYGGLAPAGAANVAQPEAGTAVVLTDMVITTDTALPIALSAGSGLYYDFTITVDTYITAATSAATGGTLAVASGTGSETANIGRDRLTYADRYQMSFAQPRGTTTATGAVNIETSLAVWRIPAGAVNDCTVNAPASVNAGLPFTFLSRNDALGLPYVGTFTVATASGAADEQGTMKVMPWEANGNAPIVPLTGINFSALPSSDLGLGPSLPILNGTGRVFDSTGGFNRPWLQFVAPFVAPAAGSLASVQSGDTVVVDEASSGFGAVKAGTYLVRHAIASNGVASDGIPIRAFSVTATGGSDTGWLGLRFPTLVAFDQGANTVTVDRLTLVYGSPSGYDFPASGTISVVRNPAYATYNGGVYTLNPQSVFRAAYTSFTVNPDDTVTFNLGIFYSDALAFISASNFFAGLSVGQQTSGMTYLPVGPLDKAPNNAVGYGLDNAANLLTAGFFDLDITGQSSGYASTIPANLLASTCMVVGTPVASTAFLPDPRTPVYPPYAVLGGTAGVPSYVDLSAGAVNWDDAHFEGTIATFIDCILPADRLTSTANLLAGVFLEPSFARPVVDLGQAVPHVVAASYTATSANQIGLRDYNSFVSVPQGYEDVHFYVRRVRRWHGQQNQLVDQLNGLKPVYEIRAGTAASYTAATRVFASATFNFTSFLTAAANVQPGDILRILDVNGDLVETATIEAVLGSASLRLRRPGLSNPVLPGTAYQIYLRNPVVPQLQSNEQLLDLITSEVIVDRRVDYGAGDTDGGLAQTANEMQDSLIADWNTTGVTVGDYVVIDPAGPLYVTGENGTRPFGDQSVLPRGPALPYFAGAPSQLDDNRGFYRVTALDPAGAYIQVNGASYFGGSDTSGADDVIYGSPGYEYAVLPTIHNSTLTGGQEGQQTLRLTAAPPVPAGSYNARAGLDAYKSIEPFPYRIIRPDSTFSQETVDLVLFMRERMLSWTEEIRYAYDNTKGGTYFVFQRDDQIDNVGSPTDPTDGLGVLSNAFLVSIVGLIDYSPFANTSDCLSILDRRFWINDTRLDTETPVGGPPPYADLRNGEGRPVLTDLVDAAIEQDNNFRTLRYAWVRFRASKVNGTLPSVTLAEEGLEDKLTEQRQSLYLQQQLPR